MLPHQRNIRLTHPIPIRLARMLRPIKHIHLPRHRLRRKQVRVLGHVPRAVHLALVAYPLRDVDARLLRGGGERVAPELATLVVVVRAVEHVARQACAFGEVHFGDLKVVRGLARGVSPEEEAVNRVGLVRWAAYRLYEHNGVRERTE